VYQLAIDNANQFPEASKKIISDFYVDDLLTGTDDPAQASILCEQVSDILKQGCFPLRKWLSNVPQVLAQIPDNDINSNILTIGENENTKTLGLHWASNDDELVFDVNTNVSNEISKRSILSIISQIFDPLGLLGASIISIKILLQMIWKEKLHWDDVVPPNIQNKWLEFRNELPFINTI
jgi:hypothetical protein